MPGVLLLVTLQTLPLWTKDLIQLKERGVYLRAKYGRRDAREGCMKGRMEDAEKRSQCKNPRLLRSFARVGSAVSLRGLSKFGSSTSVLKFMQLGSSLLLRSFARVGSSASLRGLSK